MPALTVLQKCRTLQLTRGLNTLIDEDDFEKVGRHKWYAHRTRYAFYAARRDMSSAVRGEFRYLHRVLVDAPPGTDVDHQNGDCLDHRRGNLRIGSHAQNIRNARRTCGKSRFKGVTFIPNGNRWCATIVVNREKINLGRHATQESAARAYDAAAREYFGEFACTNADLFGDY